MASEIEGPGNGREEGSEREKLQDLVDLLDEVVFALDAAGQATAAAHVHAARSLVINRLSEIG